MPNLITKRYVFAGVVIELTLSASRAEAKDITFGQIPNITKDLPRHIWRRYKKRSLDKIEMVVVHHSATKIGSAKAYARHHVNKRGWPGIGYHFVIDKEGNIQQTNGLETISYHVSGQNTNSIGIVMTGNYDEQKPPKMQLYACAKLIELLQESLGKHLKIRGHSAFAAKSCPGKHVNMEDIISLVDNTL